jgi:pimeloyl-ACP methyl ester carboxylesterase
VKTALRGIEIYAEVRGAGRPFVMLHSSPGFSARSMAALEPSFRRVRGWRRIYPDLPGHGRTAGSPRIRDIDGYLATVLEYLDAVAPSGRLALGGCSFGAYLALGVARKRPQRLSGLLLSIPEIHFSPLEDRADARAAGRPDPTPDEARRLWKGYDEDTEWLQGLPFRDVAFDLYRNVRPFPRPTLLLLGRQDARFRSAAYWKLLPGFPRATFAVLDGASHGLWQDRPRLARELVRDWLARVIADGSTAPLH